MDNELAEDIGCPKIQQKRIDDIYITNAILPNGRHIPLLKTLLTSVCENNCYYCPFRSGRDFRRATLKPDEMARLFFSLYKAGIIKGIFLSSGLTGGGIRTQDKLIDTVEILRHKYQFRGYIHLKIMPGAEYEQVFRSLQIADRVSVNLEAPNTDRLNILAPNKNFNQELIKLLEWIHTIRNNNSPHKTWNRRWPSSTTQFVVGPAGESDHELLSTSKNMLFNYNLGRIYFRAFNPSPNTPLENHAPTPPVREHRLYQALHLIRDYSFSHNELVYDKTNNLSTTIDPKTHWAKIYLQENPVEINTASRRVLLRIPGIGPKSLSKILSTRKIHKINDISELYKLGINTKRAAPFLLINGKKCNFQLSLI
jgi:predicted DNA-binding helix-hairpin-helix protein